MASPPEAPGIPKRTAGEPRFPSGSIFERALDLVFPPTCVTCGKVGAWICRRCWHEVNWLQQKQCRGCGRVWLGHSCAYCLGGESALQSLDAVAAFEDTAREAVHALKFEGQHAIATLMARLLAERAPTGMTLVVPVPLHPTRRRERGYDQCVMLAQRTAKALDMPCNTHAIRRVRRTKQQAGLSGSEARTQNMKGAFEASLEVEGDIILLIDDVTTSGATLESAASSLMERGAAEVHGLVFSSARTFAGRSE